MAASTSDAVATPGRMTTPRDPAHRTTFALVPGATRKWAPLATTRSACTMVRTVLNQTHSSQMIGRNQSQSDVSRRNQSQSDAIRSNQKQSDAIRRNQTQSDAIKCNEIIQKQPKANKNKQNSDQATVEINQKQSKPIKKSKAITSNRKQSKKQSQAIRSK